MVIIIGTLHLCKTVFFAVIARLCNSQAVVHGKVSYEQAILQNFYTLIMHRKVLHNSQGMCIEKFHVTGER